jgi:hypothetical protein
VSWAVGYDSTWRRDIGYGVPAVCDAPDCSERIDRGLGYVCGGQPFGGDDGCGLYFCSNHLSGSPQKCGQCHYGFEPVTPKPDLPEWTHHKLTDPSWAQWRATNGLDGQLS